MSDPSSGSGGVLHRAHPRPYHAPDNPHAPGAASNVNVQLPHWYPARDWHPTRHEAPLPQSRKPVRERHRGPGWDHWYPIITDAFKEEDVKRDPEGKFAAQGGSSAGKVAINTTDEELNKAYPTVGDLVDGRAVRDHVPNMESIDSSFSNYELLDGVREVPMSYFPAEAERTVRTRDLAKKIDASKEINPLIVAVDDQGPYILEGGHRYDALKILGAKSFPARVVLDLDSLPETLSGDQNIEVAAHPSPVETHARAPQETPQHRLDIREEVLGQPQASTVPEAKARAKKGTATARGVDHWYPVRAQDDFDPEQPRNEKGEWTEGGGSGAGKGVEAIPEPLRKQGFDIVAYHATHRDLTEFGDPSEGYRGATYFGASREQAERGAVGGAQVEAGSEMQTAPPDPSTRKPYKVIPAYMRSDDIAGMSWSPAEKKWHASLPDKIVGTANLDKVWETRPKGSDIQYADDVYEIENIDWIKEQLDKGVSAEKLDRKAVYRKRPVPENLSWDEVQRTHRDIYGQMLGGYNTGSDKPTLKRLEDSGQSAFLVSDEAGVSIVHGKPHHKDKVRIAQKEDAQDGWSSPRRGTALDRGWQPHWYSFPGGLDAEFKEEEHPRDKGGKFTGKGKGEARGPREEDEPLLGTAAHPRIGMLAIAHGYQGRSNIASSFVHPDGSRIDMLPTPEGVHWTVNWKHTSPTGVETTGTGARSLRKHLESLGQKPPTPPPAPPTPPPSPPPAEKPPEKEEEPSLSNTTAVRNALSAAGLQFASRADGVERYTHPTLNVLIEYRPQAGSWGMYEKDGLSFIDRGTTLASLKESLAREIGPTRQPGKPPEIPKAHSYDTQKRLDDIDKIGKSDYPAQFKVGLIRGVANKLVMTDHLRFAQDWVDYLSETKPSKSEINEPVTVATITKKPGMTARERERHERNWADAPQDLLRAMASVPALTQIEQKPHNAYYSAGKHLIAMMADQPERAAGVWRHEFGHAMDYEGSNHSKAYGLAMDHILAEADHLLAQPGAMRMSTGNPVSDDEWAELRKQGLTRADFEPFVARGPGIPFRVARRIIRHILNPGKYKPNYFRFDELQVASDTDSRTRIADFFGAMTYNKIGWGHEDSYYAKSSDNRATEMFANYVSLIGGPGGKVYRAMLHSFAPETCKTFDNIIADMGDPLHLREKPPKSKTLPASLHEYA